jgi:hypothetical protein
MSCRLRLRGCQTPAVSTLRRYAKIRTRVTNLGVSEMCANTQQQLRLRTGADQVTGPGVLRAENNGTLCCVICGKVGNVKIFSSYPNLMK